MQRTSGEIAFIDFGLSRHLQLPDLLSEEFRLPLGTAPYMAPEQALGRRDEPRSDIFALGVLLYHLTTGERPFGNPQRKSGLKQRLWQEPIPPRQHRPETPPWLQEIILRCLEVAPRNRYATGAQLAFEISHPDQIRLTDRAHRQARSGLASTLRRWSRRGGIARELLAAQTPVHLSSAPIVAVAVDLSPGMEELQELLRITARRILETLPGARLACVNVLKQHRLAMDFTLDSEGRNVHLQRLAELKHWARPLEEVAERVTWHVLEAVDPAAAILDYAQANHVDHILIGARANSALRRYLGSVSAQVVAEAPCSVTVVRVPSYADEAEMPASPRDASGRAA
jgi:non-specific serine/threonine protein kinase/protein-serine/threonine kinase